MYTVQLFAKERAPILAKINGLPAKKIEPELRQFMFDFLRYGLRRGKEIELPFGSGIFYRKIDSQHFVVREDTRRVRRMLKHLLDPKRR